jgi:hypothetical protein
MAVSEALRLTGQPEEKWWPYDPFGPTGDKPDNPQPLFRCKTTLRQLSSNGVRESLETNVPILIALRMTKDWYDELESPYIIPMGSPTSLRHAVVAVGLGKDSRGGLFVLISNTWGESWGNGGCAWLPWDYVDKNFVGLLRLERSDVN